MSKITSKKQSGKKPEGKKTVSRGTKKAVSRETKKTENAAVKKPPVVRSRSWNLILYPDCEAHNDILYYLSGDNPEGIKGFYILHKGEPKTDEKNKICRDENGNIIYKKDHYHVTITYKNARSLHGVYKAFSYQIEKALIEPTSDINSTYLYMLHRTYDCFKVGKRVYNHSDIKPLGNDSDSYLLKVSGGGSDLKETVSHICEASSVAFSCQELLNVVLDSYGDNELKFLIKNAYFVKTFMRGGDK